MNLAEWLIPVQLIVSASVCLAPPPDRAAENATKPETTPPAVPAVFLLDDSRRPHVELSWLCADGTTTTIEGERQYLTAVGRTALGRNLEAYIGLGGARLDAGLLIGEGWSIRAGFYKTDRRAPLFAGLADEAPVTVTVSGIRFNQPCEAVRDSWVLHGRYEAPTAVCAPGPQGVQMYATTSPTDTLGGRITTRNGRLGVFADGDGSLRFDTAADGSLSMTAVIPYRFFKHPEDPWLRENPGDFDEPWHFHIEFVVVPTPISPSSDEKTRGSKSQPAEIGSDDNAGKK